MRSRSTCSSVMLASGVVREIRMTSSRTLAGGSVAFA